MGFSATLNVCNTKNDLDEIVKTRPGLGIAVKIADGSNRARSVALLAILDYLGVISEKEKHQLQAHIAPGIVNSRGRTVGEIRPAASWL